MLKNYFCNLGNIFKNTFVFFKDTFKETAIIWGLIFIQALIAIPLTTVYETQNMSLMSTVYKILSIIGIIVFIICFLNMIKRIFNLVSTNLEIERISNKKILTSLLAMGLLNLIPMIIVIACMKLVWFYPNLELGLKIIVNIFTVIYYLSLSLSISSVVKWQNSNVFVAIYNGVKVFFKKFFLALPTIGSVLFLSCVVTFILPLIICIILMWLNLLNKDIIDAIYAVMNVFSIFTIVSLYIGVQTNLLKENN